MMVTTASEIDRWRTKFNDANERIKQLEAQCKVLAAEVDRQRPIVEAAYAVVGSDDSGHLSAQQRLRQAVAACEAAKREGGR